MNVPDITMPPLTALKTSPRMRTGVSGVLAEAESSSVMKPHLQIVQNDHY